MARTDRRFRLTIAHPLEQSRIWGIGRCRWGLLLHNPLSFLRQTNPNPRILTEDPKDRSVGAETSALYRNIGTVELHTHFKSLKTLDTSHGHRRATTVACRQIMIDGAGSSDL